MINDAVNLWCSGTKCENCYYAKECTRVKNVGYKSLKCDTCWHRNTIDCKNFIHQAKLRNIVILDCGMYIEDRCR